MNPKRPRNGSSQDRSPKLLHEELTHFLIGAFFEVYNRLGDGFLEGVYSSALAIELRDRGHQFQREVPLDVFYKGEKVGFYRADFVVSDVVCLELKAVEGSHTRDIRQLLNYLRASEIEVGFLFYFCESAKFYRVVSERERKSDG
jgi:GxxExxY protein